MSTTKAQQISPTVGDRVLDPLGIDAQIVNVIGPHRGRFLVTTTVHNGPIVVVLDQSTARPADSMPVWIWDSAYERGKVSDHPDRDAVKQSMMRCLQVGIEESGRAECPIFVRTDVDGIVVDHFEYGEERDTQTGFRFKLVPILIADGLAGLGKYDA